MEGIIALFIPICGILIAPIFVWLAIRPEIKSKEEIHKTFRLMIENGQTVSPELMEKMASKPKTDPVTRKENDLRWGVLLIALGFGIILYGIFEDGMGPFGSWAQVWEYFGMASIFIIIGIARLGLWKYSAIESKP